jgi:hypothetical protein
MKKTMKSFPDHDNLAAQRPLYTVPQPAPEAIAASRNDPRPGVAAETVFAELYALIDDIEAERRST